MLPCQRHRFSLPEDVHYLNSAYISPLPGPVAEAGREAIRRLECPVDLTPADFFRDADRLRALFVRLVGGEDPSRVAIVPAVSYGASLVARNLELDRGRNVVVAAEQFPSNVYPWRRVAREAGAEVRTVPRPGQPAAEPGSDVGQAWTEAVLEAMDGDTALVALPQAHWTDGTLFRLEEVGARAREVGAAFVVDGTQTVGAHPFRLPEVRPDALFCAGYKWLLGPYAVGFAWLGPRFDDAEPLEETWLGRAGSEDFRGLVDYTDEYRGDASRLDVGERSNFVLLPMQVAALELILEWGVEAVAEYCRALTGRAARGARERGLTAGEAGERCANIVGLGLPEGFPVEALLRELERRRVFVSRRGAALRVSPHVFNDAADVDALLEALDAVA